MSAYRYSSLQDNDSIRVIELSPGTYEDSCVHIYITRRQLSDPALRYEALSYTWGDSLDLEKIFCGYQKAELLVTRNCYNAMRSLRQGDKARTIWIDAICIDQQNISERSAQVRIMDRIYATAFQVVVYLGDETPGSRILFDELIIADDLYQSTQSFTGRPVPNADLVCELDNLFRRSWFSRIWVIQEVAVAEEVIIMCGTSIASMLALYKCAFGYSGHRVTKSLIPVSVKAAVHDFELTGGTAMCIWKLSAGTRNCGATDPRDKIFALKALIEDHRRELDQFIDYGRSVESVFNDVTMFLLPHIGLWLLLAVRHPHTLIMPSWMPDWSGKSAPNNTWYIGDLPATKPTEEFTICHLNCSHIDCLGRHAVLRVQGIQHSRISHLGAPFDFESAEDICYKAIRQIISELEVAHLQRGLGYTCESLYPDILPLPIYNAIQYLDETDRIGLVSRGDIRVNPCLDWTLNNKYTPTLMAALQNCRIFLTTDGTIGLAPTEACEGDTLCILRGSYSPSILRQRLEDGWTLVSGDCFVPSEFSNSDDDDDFFSDYVDMHADKEQEFLIW